MFFKEVNRKDSGDTIISNIFIDIFMPMANGLYVQVYLMGYRQACDPKANPNFNNVSLAKNLGVPLSDVINAWKYWEQKNIVKMHKNGVDDDFDFSIEFIDLKNYYNNNIDNTVVQPVQSDTDKLLEARDNPSIVRMFNSINKIIGRPLAPSENIKILELINEYNLTPDLVVYAYEYSKEQKNGNPKPINYVESVLRGWYDANIISVEDAKNSFVARKDRYTIYRSVLNQLGFSNRQPTDSEKEIIDIWIDKYNFSPELISYACSKSINTPNPSISYINGIIENWYSKDITTLEDVKKEEEEFRANKQKEITKTKTETKNHNYNNSYNKDRTPKVVTRYHNSFNEHFRKYSEDEVEAKLLRVQNSKKAK